MTATKARKCGSSSEWPSSSPKTSRWAVEETGRNSVAAWTSPSRTAERIDMRGGTYPERRPRDRPSGPAGGGRERLLYEVEPVVADEELVPHEAGRGAEGAAVDGLLGLSHERLLVLRRRRHQRRAVQPGLAGHRRQHL